MATIIGRGLLACAFQNTSLSNKYLIFASGVSKSTETRDHIFQKEFFLLQKVLKDNPFSTIIYFSSCSVYGIFESPYVRHKIAMEKIIVQSAHSYHIYRLPQVVGVVNNTTIISYFVRAALTSVEVRIEKDAYRNLIGIIDISRIVEFISSYLSENLILNIASIHSTPVFDIYHHITSIVARENCSVLVDGGESYNIPVDKLRDFIGSGDIIFNDNYWKKILDFYVPKVVNLILDKGLK